MNTSPWLEIIVITLSLALVITLIARFIYKVKHHIPTGECSSCATKNSLLKYYSKTYNKNLKK